MKTSIILGLALLAATPSGLFANPTTDRQIEDVAKGSYNFRRVLDNNVNIKVRDGVATLTGKVRSEDERRIAEDTVSAIDGVTRVDNQIRVESTAREGSDEWIALKIRSRLALRANVSMTNTNVDVRDGVVLLTGTAESQAQKELTEAYVKDIAGVRAVENKLQVLPRERVRVERDGAGSSRRDVTATPRTGPDDRDTIGEKIDDGSIIAQIKYELFAHRSTSGLKTKVSCHDGHVVVSGDAKNAAEKDLVTTLAKNVRGVVSVENNMTVKER